jgi:Skp family chaperone for outer membrane proteins
MTMKNMIGRTICILLLVSGCALTAQAQTRIGIVDYKKVVAGYWKTKEATSALKDRREDLLKELKGLGDNIKKGEEEYRDLSDKANDQAVSSEERDKKKKEAEAKLKAISEMKERARDFDRNASANLNEQAQRMSERIDERIRAVVSARAKTAGYTLVLDVAARSAENRPVVLFTNGENDITDGVIEQLNADAPPDVLKKEKEEKEKEKK